MLGYIDDAVRYILQLGVATELVKECIRECTL